MNIIQRNKLLLTTCLTILILCAIYHAVVYFLLPLPDFIEPISVKVLGNEGSDFAIEMRCAIANKYHIPYKLYFTDAKDDILTDIEFIEDTVRIPMFSRQYLSLRATLPRKTIAQLMADGKSGVSFHLLANAQVKSFLPHRQRKIDQFLPINIYKLLYEFLTDEYQKNMISINNNTVRFENVANNATMNCEISIKNRGGLDLHFTGLEEGKVSINRRITGSVQSFTPIYFRSTDEVLSTRMSFFIPERVDRSQEIGYMISGNIKIGLWNWTFHVPIELVGEVVVL